MGASTRRPGLVLAAMCVALATVVSAVSSLNVALPDVARDLRATQTQLEWIIDAYAVVFSGLLLLAGALGDRLGRRPLLLGGLVVFSAAAGAGVVASSPGALIAVRAVMGIGAAAIARIVAPWYPRSAKSRRAASRMSARVEVSPERRPVRGVRVDVRRFSSLIALFSASIISTT